MTRCTARHRSWYQSWGKRLLDLSLTIPACVLLSPVVATVAVAIYLRMGRPIFFRQARSGRNGATIFVCKFRTMSEARDSAGQLLPDDQRLTRLGSWLRRLSLDELPQFWNVLEGTMSLVGPRPLLVEYLVRYSPEQNRRHDVVPGVTGWAQVNGRNTLSWEERFELDVWYVDHVSGSLDLKILLLTVNKVLRSKDVSAQGHATMPKFMGSAPRLTGPQNAGRPDDSPEHPASTGEPG